MFRKRTPYPSDLTDAQWQALKPHLPPPAGRGRKRVVNLREIVNAIFYVLHTGCQWDYLPHDFPAADTVYGYFQRWRKDGTWERLNSLLRGQVRQAVGKNTSRVPGSWIASRSDDRSRWPARLRQWEKGQRPQAACAGRHIGLVLCVVVHSAQLQDRDGARLVFERILTRFPRLKLIWPTHGNPGPKLGDWIKSISVGLEIIKRSDPVHTFEVQPHRWIVERTFVGLTASGV